MAENADNAMNTCIDIVLSFGDGGCYYLKKKSTILYSFRLPFT